MHAHWIFCIKSKQIISRSSRTITPCSRPQSLWNLTKTFHSLHVEVDAIRKLRSGDAENAQWLGKVCWKLYKRIKLLRMKAFACPIDFDAISRKGLYTVPLFPLDFPVPLWVLIDVSDAPNTTDAITIKPNIPLMLPVRQKAKPCCSQL